MAQHKIRAALHTKKLIAVTGGIGSGKSFILRCFHKLKFRTFSFDEEIGKKLYIKGGRGYNKVKELFPEAICNYGVDKQKLSKIVFSDREALQKLENAIHPIIREEFWIFAEKHFSTSQKTIIVEVPLLFENGLHKNFDIIICAIAPEKIRKERVFVRKNMTETKFNAIISRQVKDEYRKLHSNYIVYTGSNGMNTFKQIKAIIKRCWN